MPECNGCERSDCAERGCVASVEGERKIGARALRDEAKRLAQIGCSTHVLSLIRKHADEIEGGQLDGAPSQLTFEMLRMANVARCSRHYHPIADWSLSDWCTAVAGELGELAGVIKNLRRAETERTNGHVIPMRGPLVDALANEAADVVIYLDLLCARAAVDLGAAVTRKFNEVSRHRLGTDILLPEEDRGARRGG